MCDYRAFDHSAKGTSARADGPISGFGVVDSIPVRPAALPKPCRSPDVYELKWGGCT